MGVEFGARSDTGRVRENNEDSFALALELNLFVLSDGMGGLAAGEVASKLATNAVINHCREAASNPSLPLIGEHLAGLSETSNRLASAIRIANRVVYAAAQGNEQKRGHGRNGCGGVVHGRTASKRRARWRQPHIPASWRAISCNSPRITRSSPNRFAAA